MNNPLLSVLFLSALLISTPDSKAANTPPEQRPTALFMSQSQHKPLQVEATVPLNFCSPVSLKKRLKQANVSIPKGLTLTFLFSPYRAIIHGNPQKVATFKKWIKRLDVPSKQIHIQAYLFAVDDDYSQHFGLNLKRQATNHYWDDLPTSAINDALWQPIHLGAHHLLALELQAKEAKGHGSILSSPSLLVTNGMTASIESGGEFPYAVIEGQHSNWQFKKIALHLKITPTLMGKNHINMNIQLHFERPSHFNSQGVPGLASQSLTTTVCIPSGHTITLGGLIEHQHNNKKTCLPWIHHLPLIGKLFCNHTETTQKNQIWILITPQLI
jgi:type II secretory pathway component HofQ